MNEPTATNVIMDGVIFACVLVFAVLQIAFEFLNRIEMQYMSINTHRPHKKSDPGYGPVSQA